MDMGLTLASCKFPTAPPTTTWIGNMDLRSVNSSRRSVWKISFGFCLRYGWRPTQHFLSVPCFFKKPFCVFGAYSLVSFWNFQHGRSFEECGCIKLRHPSLYHPKWRIIYPRGCMGLVYLPTFGWFLWYINVGKCTIHRFYGYLNGVTFFASFLVSMHYISGAGSMHSVVSKNVPYHCCIDLRLPGAKNVHEEQLAMGISMVCACFVLCRWMPIQSTSFVAICGTAICLYVFAFICTIREWVNMCTCTSHVHIIYIYASLLACMYPKLVPTPIQHATCNNPGLVFGGWMNHYEPKDQCCSKMFKIQNKHEDNRPFSGYWLAQ